MKATYLLLATIILTATAPVMAQKAVPAYSVSSNIPVTDSVPAKKWFISKYVGISSSLVFFNGGNASVFSVPVGIQLNRRLSNNWYAFAGVSAAPSYINFNHSFLTANTPKTFQGNDVFNNNRFDINTRAEMGLMYTNDQKTFSISGSIGIERSNYPWLSPALGTGFRPVPIQYGIR